MQPGVTTIADARSFLGEPFQTIASSDGITMLTYGKTTVQQRGMLAGSSDVIVVLWQAYSQATPSPSRSNLRL